MASGEGSPRASREVTIDALLAAIMRVKHDLSGRMERMEERIDGMEGSFSRRMDTLEVGLDSNHSIEPPNHCLARFKGGLCYEVVSQLVVHKFDRIEDLVEAAVEVERNNHAKKTFGWDKSYKPLEKNPFDQTIQRYPRLEGTNSSTPKPKGIICFKCQGWGHKASEFPNKRNIVLVEGDPYFVGDKVTKNDVSEGTPQEYDGDDGEPERVVGEGEFNVPCRLMRRTPHDDAWPEEGSCFKEGSVLKWQVADSWQFGSISFGRFENEALCWERRSSFTQNRYLEEVEKCIKPGSVTEKRAYFEELFRRRALLSQSSSDCQDGADSQANNDGSENTDYEGDFEHVNEIGHSACFVENHDRAATLLENGKYQASENEGYARRFEHVNEVVHSARFDEKYDRSTHLSKNGKYQAENTGYDGDSERVNEVGDSVYFEESFDGSNNRDIKVTECGGEGSINGDIEVSVPELLEAEAKFNRSAGNSAFNDPEVCIRKRNADCSFDLRCVMCRKRKKQRSNSYGEISISKKLPCLPSTVNLTTAQKKTKFFMKLEEKVQAKKEETRHLQARKQEKKEAEIKQLRRNLNFKETLMPAFYREPGHCSEKNKDGQSWEDAGARAVVREVYNRCSTNERLNVADSPQVSEVTIHPSANLSESSVPSAATSKMSKQTQSNRTVAPKREQEKTQVANSTRPRTSDSIRRNKEFKAKDKTKVLARRTGNHATRKDVRSVDLSHSTRVGHLAVGVAS
ncbi:hypothetical protein T459_35026 [Capsicum annuum]|uniref:TPX2 C-terminal domain-containing protein n=1 Tax=Capsicum annuum TaxID=4072 RepID=A0A2G2XUE6_CAPAN|nr:hypothetical protein T459_35026 [Capsicum annuum]